MRTKNGFGVPTLTKTRVSQPTNGCTPLCLAPSFPYTFGPLARGLTPSQGGIRTAGRKSISDREVLARLVRELHSERLDELGEAADGWRAFVGESDAVVVAVVAPRGYELRACLVGVVLRLVEARDVPLEEVGHLEELEVGGEAHDAAAELVELLALEVVASGRACTDAEELCSCNSARKTCPLLA